MFTVNFFRRIVHILVVILTPIILLPLPVVIGTEEAKCAYILFTMAIYWVTEALPISVTSLIPIVLTPLVGLGSAKSVAAHYINDTSMLFIGGLIVAVAIEHWNIHKRLALAILMLVGTEIRWLMLGLMFPTWLLSMWISNTASTAMMLPLANAILEQLKTTKNELREENKSNTGYDNNALELGEKNIPLDDKDNVANEKLNETTDIDSETTQESTDHEHDRICKMLTICIAHAATIGGIGSLTGTGPNIVLKGQSDILYEKYGGTSPITFSTWFSFGLPISVVMFVLAWFWLQTFFLRRKCLVLRSDDDQTRTRIKTVLRNEYKSLGPISFAQVAVFCHFLLLVVLWITFDLREDIGWKHWFPSGTVSNSTPAVLLSISLFVFPSRIRNLERKERIPALLTWKIVEKKLPWGVIILLGGGFAIAFICQEYGLSTWLGNQLAVLSYLKPWILNMVICIIVAAATEVTSNVAMCTLILPILAEVALQLQLHPLYLMFPATLATSFAFMLPVATAPNAFAFSYGYVVVTSCPDVKVGFLMNILGIFVLVIATETLGDAVFGFHTLPEIFKSQVANIAVTLNNTCPCPNTEA